MGETKEVVPAQVAAFLESCGGLSPHTVRTYRSELLGYVGRNGSSAIDRSIVRPAHHMAAPTGSQAERACPRRHHTEALRHVPT